jgi:hypothetical protein
VVAQSFGRLPIFNIEKKQERTRIAPNGSNYMKMRTRWSQAENNCQSRRLRYIAIVV